MYRVVIKYVDESEEILLDSAFSLEEALDIQEELLNTSLNKEVQSVDIERV